MTENHSEAFEELTNLIETARWHQRYCLDAGHDNCNVMLYLLGMTAKRLVNHCWLHERNTARRLIAENNWV